MKKIVHELKIAELGDGYTIFWYTVCLKCFMVSNKDIIIITIALAHSMGTPEPGLRAWIIMSASQH